MKLILPLLFSLCAFGHDWIIVPGERVGPVTSHTSEEELVRQLGANTVKRKPIPLGDSESFEDGTIVYGDDPSRALAIRWRDEGRTRPRLISVCYGLVKGECRWKLANGISFGTSVKELEQLNGKSFVLTGFSYQDQGMIANWMNGKLAAFMEPGRRVLLSIEGESARGDFVPALSFEEIAALMRGMDFSSSHPLMQKLNPRVSDMLVELR